MRILPLPKGVSNSLYSRALRNIPFAQRPRARNMMVTYGHAAAKSLESHDIKAFNLISDHGKHAALAIAEHGSQAFELYDDHGLPALKVLSALSKEEIKKMSPMTQGRLDALEDIIKRNPIQSVKQSIQSSTPIVEYAIDQFLRHKKP